MKRIIPIICIVCACLCLAVAAVGLVMICAATRVGALAVVAVPCAIIGAATSLLSIGVDALFFKDKLCRAALIVASTAELLSIVSVIIWFAVL